ncbi:hypothetical protein QBC35DRAFT_286739 [Podospora australis]|uniref:Asl1-like glycosyl hydrolase catalytic domain-containing protein n=1 Tax=Podospora australis TaxID=1536484 RepID=A0AAN6WR97_9PEZI|nr:hypothetical protein QBC35DRAFT_286739 [Podospora australis]
MVVRKRLLLWDYTNTRDIPNKINDINYNGPIVSVSNWNAWYPQELKNRLPFRPMVRTPAQLGGDEWTWIRDGAFKYDIVHFYNEPERQNISPQDAANKWKSHMVGILRKQKGKKLVGPSVASDDKGRKWLRDFMNAIGGDKPDYLGVHYYGTDVNAAKKYITDMYNEYKLPIIVSEIACIDRDGKKVERWTVDMANWMDGQGWIKEYGFFGCMRNVADSFVSPAAQLMDKNGNFTALMRKLMNEQPMK